MALISKDVIEDAAKRLVIATRDHLQLLRRNTRLVDEFKAAETSYFNGTADFYDGISRVRIPALHQAVERIVPKMDRVNFPTDGKFFEVKPKDTRDDLSKEDAEIVTSLIKQQLKDVNVRPKMIGIYRNLCIYGTVVVKTFWEKKEVPRFKREDGKRRKMWEVVFDNPDFYSPSIWDVYFDPKDENLDGAVLERIPVNYSDLWNLRKRTNDEGEEVGIYDTKRLIEIREWNLNEEATDSDKKDSDKERSLDGHTYGPQDHKVELWQAWMDLPKWLLTGDEKDKENREVEENALVEVAIAGSKCQILRIIDNPFDHGEKPYLKGNYIKVDGRAYGLGVMSVNISLEAELNTLRNQLVDLRTFILKKKWLKDRSANIDESQLKDVHNFVIDTDMMTGLRDLVPADFSPSANIQQGIIKQDIEESTGASKLLGGMPQGSSIERTAAGVTTVVAGGLERFELVAVQFQEDILKNLVRQFWQLNQQFLPEGRDVALVGKGIIRVVPEEIPLEGFDLNFLGVHDLGEKAFKAQSLNLAFQNIKEFIPFGLDPLPVFFEYLRVLGLGNLIPEIDKRPESELENSPEGELQLLMSGRKVRIDMNDNHEVYIAAYKQLLEQPNLPDNVKANTLEAVGQRMLAMQILSQGKKDTPNV